MRSVFIILYFAVAGIANAAGPVVDSAMVSKIVSDGNTKVVTEIRGQAKGISDSVKTILKPAPPVQNMKPTDFWTYLLCFLPVLFFLFLLVSIAVKLGRDNISLAHFLVDKEQQVALKKEETKVRVANAAAKETLVRTAGGNPEAVRAVVANLNQVGETDPPPAPDPTQSTSRLIVFVTGITSLLIAVCMTSFYFYRVSLGDRDIDFASLSTVLYGLGLGILPYGFTKIASVLK